MESNYGRHRYYVDLNSANESEAMLRIWWRSLLHVLSATLLLVALVLTFLGVRSIKRNQGIGRHSILTHDKHREETDISVRLSRGLVGLMLVRTEVDIEDLPPDQAHGSMARVRWERYVENDLDYGIPVPTRTWLGVQFFSSHIDRRPSVALRGSTWSVFLPFWFATVFLMLPGGVQVCAWAARRHRRARRKRLTLCTNCGYDLRGAGGACPECGSLDRSTLAGDGLGTAG